MANSIITKRALTSAFKELMVEMPFSKITVSMICDRCGMNRKSFYYHFKDKEDLISNILDIEYFEGSADRENLDVWERFSNACTYFYDNRSFYSVIIEEKDCDTFYEHYIGILSPVVTSDLIEVTGESYSEYYINFYADAIVCAFERWITSTDAIDPGAFSKELHNCLYVAMGNGQSVAKR